MRSRVLIAVIFLALAGASAVLWHKVVRDHFVPRNFGVVEQGRLYRSARLTDSALRKVHGDYGIRTIIDLGAYAPGSSRDIATQRIADELGMERYVFGLSGDGTGNPNDYVLALRLMSEARNQPALVMCGAGAERTGAAVMLYRRVHDGISLQQSYPESFLYKHDPGRSWKMLAYLADWSDEIISAFERGGWVKGMPVPSVRHSSPASATAGAPAVAPSNAAAR